MNLRKLAVAFAIALIISGICTMSLGRKLTAKAAEHKEPRHYVVPARPLNADEMLKADNVVVADWPSDVEVPGAFTKPADVVGRTVLYPVDKGQPLTDKLVSAPGAGSGLAGRIPEGMRAISLRTDEVIGVAGFLAPGSRLDVLATYRSDKSPEPTTVTVLQNAEVIAVGQKTQPDPDGKPATVTVVTLLLTPEDAEKAVMASTQGTIHFVMRSGSDGAVSKNAPVVLSTLTDDRTTGPVSQTHKTVEPGTLRTHSVAPRATPRPAAQTYTVQTILGEKEVNNTFQVVSQ